MRTTNITNTKINKFLSLLVESVVVLVSKLVSDSIVLIVDSTFSTVSIDGSVDVFVVISMVVGVVVGVVISSSHKNRYLFGFQSH